MTDVVNDIRIVNYYKFVADPNGGQEPVKVYMHEFEVKKNGSDVWEKIESLELPWSGQ